jgi:hypothetical protein
MIAPSEHCCHKVKEAVAEDQSSALRRTARNKGEKEGLSGGLVNFDDGPKDNAQVQYSVNRAKIASATREQAGQCI